MFGRSVNVPALLLPRENPNSLSELPEADDPSHHQLAKLTNETLEREAFPGVLGDVRPQNRRLIVGKTYRDLPILRVNISHFEPSRHENVSQGDDEQLTTSTDDSSSESADHDPHRNAQPSDDDLGERLRDLFGESTTEDYDHEVTALPEREPSKKTTRSNVCTAYEEPDAASFEDSEANRIAIVVEEPPSKDRRRSFAVFYGVVGEERDPAKLLSEPEPTDRSNELNSDAPKKGLYQRVVECLYGNPRSTSSVSNKEVPIERTIADVHWGSNLNANQLKELKNVVSEYPDLFAEDLTQLTQTCLLTHDIHVKEAAKPRTAKGARRFAPLERQFIEDEIRKQLKAGVIEESNGPWVSPLSIAKKKDGSLRMCVAYIQLNQRIESMSFPLPLIDVVLDRAAGHALSSSLDGFSAYYTVPLTLRSRGYTQFTSPIGTFQYRVLPFGIKMAPSCFCQFMSKAFRHIPDSILSTYLDDVVLYSDSFDDHCQHLRQVMDAVRTSGMKLKAKKCEIGSDSVIFLGHRLSKEGISVVESKVEAITSWPLPRNPSDVRTFLGLVNYYRRFIKDCGKIARPLVELTKKNNVWKWGATQYRAFAQLQKALVDPPVLAVPQHGIPYRLDTDASDTTVGSVLSQNERPIAYFSKSLTKSQQNYSVTERELLAVILSVQRFRHYVLGSELEIVTDHSAILGLINNPTVSGRLARWQCILSEFDFRLTHRKGNHHQNADALSRRPRPNQEEIQEAYVLRSVPVRWTEAITDEKFRPVVHFLRTGIADASTSALRRRIRVRSRRFTIQDGKLLYLDVDDALKIVVHHGDALGLAKEYHEAGHFGRDITVTNLRRIYWWPTMTRDVKSVIAACKSCANWSQRLRHARLHPLQPVEPFEIVVMDWIVGLPRSSTGNCAIITVTDSFSKYVEARAFPRTGAAESLEFLVHNIMARWEPPGIVITDNGTHFLGEFRDFLTQSSVVHKRTAVYHPQSAGQDENTNKLLIDRIRRLSTLETLPHCWDEWIPAAVYHLNTRRSPTRRYSALECLCGITFRRPLERRVIQDVSGAAEGVEARIAQTELDSTRELHLLSLGNIRDECLQQLDDRGAAMKKRYDQRLRRAAMKFNAGESVYVRQPQNVSKWKRRRVSGVVAWCGDATAHVFINGHRVVCSVDDIKRRA